MSRERYQSLKKDAIQNGDGTVRLEALGIPEEYVRTMEYGNRVACIPDAEDHPEDEQLRLLGLPVDEEQELWRGDHELVVDQAGRLPRFKRLEKYGKVIQIVGGHPSAKDYIRPEGVDEVWAINPRPWWPEDNPPDLIMTRDIYYLEGPSSVDPGAVRFGVDTLMKFPAVPILISADLGYWVTRRLSGEVPCPPHLQNREILELPMQNFWDGEFCNLAGYTIGMAMAAVRFVGAKVVLTGVVCDRTPAEQQQIIDNKKKLLENVQKEDAHIAQEMLDWMNPRGGKVIWTHGPTIKGSVVPAWPPQEAKV